jgi:putative oxidoreductase
MFQPLQAIFSVSSRVLICTIFFMSAVGNKIPHFNNVVKVMESAGVPMPSVMLAGAIVFLLAGSVSVILGVKARIGASLLLVFLVLATYYFHAFWKLDGQEQQMQMIQFMKNLSMMGAMLFIVANGSGAYSLDSKLSSLRSHTGSSSRRVASHA